MKGSLLLYRLPTKDETSETIVQNLYCPISYISVSFFAKLLSIPLRLNFRQTLTLESEIFLQKFGFGTHKYIL